MIPITGEETILGYLAACGPADIAGISRDLARQFTGVQTVREAQDLAYSILDDLIASNKVVRNFVGQGGEDEGYYSYDLTYA